MLCGIFIKKAAVERIEYCINARNRLAEAERDFPVAERKLATLTDDCEKLSKEIERHTS